MNSSQRRQSTGLLAWFAANPVAANLLMLLILIGGVVGYNVMDKEVFPRFNPQQIEVSALYPGAGPLEIEASVCVRIEAAINDVPGVKRLYTEIPKGECYIKVSVLPDTNVEQVINALQGRIQGIPRLPKNLEKIEVRRAERNDDDGVIWVSLHGRTDLLSLQHYGEHIRADLERISGVRWVRNYLVEALAKTLRQAQGRHTEQLDVERAKFFVHRHIRPQYACRNCATITAAPIPPAIIDGGMAAVGVLNWILISKYLDHLPLYRLEQIAARGQVILARSTLAEWVGRTEVALQPLVDRLIELLLRRGTRHVDETPVPQCIGLLSNIKLTANHGEQRL